MRSHMWSSKPSAAVNPEPSVWNNVFNTVEPDWSGLFTVFLMMSSATRAASCGLGHVHVTRSTLRLTDLPNSVEPLPNAVICPLSI